MFSDRLKRLSHMIKDELNLRIASLSVIKAAYRHAGIVKCFIEYLESKENRCSDNEKIASNADSNTRANKILDNAGLLDHSLIDKANKPHWLYANLMICDDDIDNVASSSLYKMLETYPAGTMLKDITGHFWVRRARAAVTRHRFITVDDQEKYYM